MYIYIYVYIYVYIYRLNVKWDSIPHRIATSPATFQNAPLIDSVRIN